MPVQPSQHQPFQVQAVEVHEAVPGLTQMYGAAPEAFATLASQGQRAWTVRQGGEVLGALLARSSPAHGAELIGGMLTGTEPEQAARALLRAALDEFPHAYAYAERLSEESLTATGFQPVSAYVRVEGPLPTDLPALPPGLTLQRLSSVPAALRWEAQHLYADQIGHTGTPPEAGEAGFGGSNDELGWVALDALGRPVGVCRVWHEEGSETVQIGAPGLRPDWRGLSLRQPLLLTACQSARSAGAPRMVMESWGESALEESADIALGLSVTERAPIYATSRSDEA